MKRSITFRTFAWIDRGSRLLLCALGLFSASLSPVQAQLPLGTVALYSDGYSQKLLRYERGNSVWEDVRKRQYIYGPHPVLPAISVWYPFDPERTYSTVITDGDPAILTSAPDGVSEHITIERQYLDGTKQYRQWLCESLGVQQTAVVGVQLPVTSYECIRTKLDRKLRSKVQERRFVQYAPSLQLVTSVVSERKWESKVRELMFLIPPDQVSAQKIAELQRQVQRIRLEKLNAQ